MRSWLRSCLLPILAVSISSSLAAFAFPSEGKSSITPFRVGLVLDKGGKDDKSFNTAAYLGSKKAEKELGIQLKFVEATDINALESLHRGFARRGYDLVIGIGFAQVEAVRKVAAKFPNAKFAIVDGEVIAPNVRSLLFQEHEGAFLVGAIAAMKSASKHVGFIGGMDIPLIRRFAIAYKAGAEFIDAKTLVIENYIGTTGEAWNNPAKAKELALSQISHGADVLFVAAGASGLGVFDAAEEKGKFAIGVDSNQNGIKPGTILTSMLKRVDNAVFTTIQEAQVGKFRAGVVRFGLADKGVDYAVDSNNEKILDASIRKRAEDIREKIIAGKIKVPDYYQLRK